MATTKRAGWALWPTLAIIFLVARPTSARITLRAVYKADSPFNVIGPSNDTSRPVGVLVDLLHLVAQEITAQGFLDNHTVAVAWHPVDDGRYGSLTPQGTWNGLPGEIVNGTADVIGSYFNVDELRQSVLLYSTPYFASGFVVITRIQAAASDPFYFVRPFQNRLWGSIFATALLSALLLYWVDRTSPFGFKHQYADNIELRRSFNLPNTFNAILMPLIGQSAVRASAWSSRIMYLGFLIFCLITMSLFTANLTAFAVVRRYDDGLQSIFDVQINQAPWCLAKDSEVDLWFTNNPDQRFYNMLSYAVFTNSDESECISLLRQGKVQAVVTSLQIAEYAVSLPPCQLQIVGRPFTQGYSAFAVSAANATLQRALSRATQHFVQTGVLDSLYRSVINGPGSCLNSDGTTNGDIDSSGMDVTNVSGVFYVAFVFFAVGFVQLGVEILLTKTVRGNSRFQRRLLRCCGWQRSLNANPSSSSSLSGLPPSAVAGALGAGEGDTAGYTFDDDADDDDNSDGDTNSTDDGGDLKPPPSALIAAAAAAVAAKARAKSKGVGRVAWAVSTDNPSVPSKSEACTAAGDGGGVTKDDGNAPLLLPTAPMGRKASHSSHSHKPPSWAAVSAVARETSLSQMLLPSALLPSAHSSSNIGGHRKSSFGLGLGLLNHRASHSEAATVPASSSSSSASSGTVAAVQLRTMTAPVVQPAATATATAAPPAGLGITVVATGGNYRPPSPPSFA